MEQGSCASDSVAFRTCWFWLRQQARNCSVIFDSISMLSQIFYQAQFNLTGFLALELMR